MRKTGGSAFETATKSEWNASDAIFERLIIIIPYRSPDLVKRIEESFEKVNFENMHYRKDIGKDLITKKK